MANLRFYNLRMRIQLLSAAVSVLTVGVSSANALPNLATNFAINPVQSSREQAWEQLENKLINDFPAAANLTAVKATCNPYALVKDGHFSLSETQDLICNKKTPDTKRLQRQFRSLSIQASRTPSQIEEYVGEFIYPRKEIESSFNNLQACVKSPKDTGKHQGRISIVGSGAGWVKLVSSIKNVSGNFYLNSSSSSARRLLSYFESIQIPFCDLDFSEPESVVTKPDVPAPISGPTVSATNSRVAMGAYQLFATLHRSCEALGIQPSLTSYEVYNPYVFAAKSQSTQCKGDDLVPRYAQTQRNPTLTRSSTGQLLSLDFSKTRATDCSSFVVSALAVAGVRIKANSNSAEQYYPTSSGSTNGNALTTHQLKWMGNAADDCLKTVRYDGTSAAVQAGDILVASGHTWIFPEADSDPFEISKMTEKDCNDLSKFSVAKIKVMDSDASMRGIGPHQKDGRSAPVELKQFAQLACKAHFEKLNGGNPNYAAEELIAPQSSNQMLGDRSVLLRPSEAAECLMPTKPVLIGLSCVEGCPALQKLQNHPR